MSSIWGDAEMTKLRIQGMFFVLAMIFLWTSNGMAACTGSSPNWTSTPDRTSVASCVSSATAGDTINVTAGDGTETWATEIVLNKTLNIIGPGRDSLTITVQTLAFDITAPLGGTNASRISGFTFDISSSSSQPAWIRLWCYDNAGCPRGWRIDHNRVTKTTTSTTYCFQQAGNDHCNPYGLIDNNIFQRCRLVTFGMLYGTQGANNRWNEALNIGGVESTYVEDNEWIDPTWIGNFFDYIDGSQGGRYVFRYNTGTNAWIESHSVQAASQRGNRLFEVYRNTSTCTDTGNCVWPASFRGGTGVMFDNSISGYNNNYARLDNVRDGSSIGIWGLCDGNSWIDGNESGKTGYLCRDQIGASTDSFLWNFSSPAPSQAKAPIYSWGNTYNTSNILNFFSENENHIQANRDYYNYNASFNGTTGVGVGTLAARPATCTTGVAYWATDQGNWNKSGSGSHGVLYKCTATNTWTLYYTPCTYPHPLRLSPSPPKNLHIVN